MTKSRLVLAPTLMLAVLVTTAFAQPPNAITPTAFQQRVAKRIVARIETRLALTDNQREQAKVILEQEKPTILALAERARQEHAELTQLSSFDESRVRDLAQKYASTNADILVERTRVRLELRAVLTDAQRIQLDQLRARFASRFGDHMQETLDALINVI